MKFAEYTTHVDILSVLKQLIPNIANTHFEKEKEKMIQRLGKTLIMFNIDRSSSQDAVLVLRTVTREEFRPPLDVISTLTIEPLPNNQEGCNLVIRETEEEDNYGGLYRIKITKDERTISDPRPREERKLKFHAPFYIALSESIARNIGFLTFDSDYADAKFTGDCSDFHVGPFPSYEESFNMEEGAKQAEDIKPHSVQVYPDIVDSMLAEWSKAAFSKVSVDFYKKHNAEDNEVDITYIPKEQANGHMFGLSTTTLYYGEKITTRSSAGTMCSDNTVLLHVTERVKNHIESYTLLITKGKEATYSNNIIFSDPDNGKLSFTTMPNRLYRRHAAYYYEVAKHIAENFPTSLNECSVHRPAYSQEVFDF